MDAGMEIKVITKTGKQVRPYPFQCTLIKADVIIIYQGIIVIAITAAQAPGVLRVS